MIVFRRENHPCHIPSHHARSLIFGRLSFHVKCHPEGVNMHVHVTHQNAILSESTVNIRGAHQFLSFQKIFIVNIPSSCSPVNTRSHTTTTCSEQFLTCLRVCVVVCVVSFVCTVTRSGRESGTPSLLSIPKVRVIVYLSSYFYRLPRVSTHKRVPGLLPRPLRLLPEHS